MKANELRVGQFFDYLGMICRCDANDLGGQPVRFGYWDGGTYRQRYCGAFCEVSALPFLDWDEANRKESAVMKICGVRLTRQSGSLVVDVETVNGWIEVIREKDDGTTPISHICNASGLLRSNNDACEQSSMDDLASSGGIRASFFQGNNHDR